MAKFCENCGNPIEQGAVFCDNCGARLDGGPAAPAQQPVQPIQQPPYTQPYQPPYAPPKPVKKKKGGLTAVVIILVVLLIAALAAYVALPKLKALLGDKPGQETEEPILTTQPAQPALPENTEPATQPVQEDPSDFEKYGIAADIVPGRTFSVRTQVRDTGEFVNGKGSVAAFTREPVPQETVDFMQDNGADVAGYDLLQVEFAIEYPDSLADMETMKFKGFFNRVTFDYYHIDLFEDANEIRKDTEEQIYHISKVLVDGQEMSVYYWLDVSANLDDDSLYYSDCRTFLVPAGYDGLVCGYGIPGDADEERIYENYSPELYSLFRLAGGTAPASPVERPTEEPATVSGLGHPAPEDFAWIADAMSGDLTGNLLGKEDFVGQWKAEILFDGIFELMTITIGKDGTVTLAPWKINYGDGWMDESDEGPYPMTGQFNYSGAGDIYATGLYGNLELYQFLESDGTQYGLGNLTLPSGEVEKVYLVRP